MKMKPCWAFARFWIGLSFVGAVWSSAAQGTVNFANGAAGVNAPVTFAGSSERVGGPGWTAQLLLVSTNEVLVPMGGSVSMGTGLLAGYFLGGSRTVDEKAPEDRVTFRVRVFNDQESLEAVSAPVAVTLGGEKMPPANLVGLASWSVPLPAPRLEVAVVEGAVELSWPAVHEGYLLEVSDRISGAQWRATGEPVEVRSDRRVVSLLATESERYFRLSRQ